MMEFPKGSTFPSYIFGDSTPGSAPRLQKTHPPGEARDKAIERARKEMQRSAGRMEDLIDELICLVGEYEPVQLVSSISVPTSTGLSNGQVGSDAEETFTWDAKVEYLLGLTLAGETGLRDVDQDATKRAMKLVTRIFDSAQAALLVEPEQVQERTPSHLDHIAFLLRLEYLFDRMAGFSRHLQEIADQIFEVNRSFYIEEMGFCPSDSIRIVTTYRTEINRRINTSRGKIAETIRTSGVPADDAVRELLHGMQALTEWTPDLLSEISSIPVGEVRALLDWVSVDWACQPGYRSPLESNLARTHPVVRLDGDRYFCPLASSIAHGLYERMDAYVKQESSSKLARRYSVHRSRAAELIARNSMVQVFGADVVFQNEHYDSQLGHGEVDCLVAGLMPLVIEVKSRGLTEQGRQGRLRRVERVSKDVVGESSAQTSRAVAYITAEGGRHFSKEQGAAARVLLPEFVSSPIRLILTLDRMDPFMFATISDELSGEDGPSLVWFTSLADLLMVRDCLSDPPSFLHYARRRAEATAAGVHVLMESDALSCYLSERLSGPIEAAGSHAYAVVSLGYFSDPINDYFNAEEVGLEAVPLETGVPGVVLKALVDSCDLDSSSWVHTAMAIMETDSQAWTKWRKFARRRSNGRRFVLPDGATSIVVSDGKLPFVCEEEGQTCLHVPAD